MAIEFHRGGAAAIVHDTVSALVGVLAENEVPGNRELDREMDPDGQYQLIRELLEPNSVSYHLRTLTSP